ncbi:hypothetical protein PR048_003648 [Dryococelus australis]|uniref:Uncharacterized protein n=1 Tax=Dryococelus australis TaxID=614101 RepID=A0ABQ9INN7_9NEOP|nr:hypothetical protein PR048_003648 [Dryococelus australis]
MAATPREGRETIERFIEESTVWLELPSMIMWLTNFLLNEKQCKDVMEKCKGVSPQDNKELLVKDAMV